MGDLIGGTALLHYPGLVTEIGGDPQALMLAQGVDPTVAGVAERLVSYAAVAAVVGTTAVQLSCPDFGMRLARRQGIEGLGPVAVLIRHAATVADAIEGVCRYLYHCAPPDIAGLQRGTHTAVFTLEIALRQMAYRDQWIEKGLMITMEALRLMLGEDFAPQRVTMKHRRISDSDVYRTNFGCSVEFGADVNSIQFPISALDRPIRGRDPTVLAMAENYLAQIGPALPIEEHIRELIHRMLKVNQANLVAVSQALMIHPRVLQRRLAEAGTSFEDVLDDVRREMAWQLSERTKQASQIATMLGYAEQSGYSRACRRWFGESPRQLIARRYIKPGSR